MTVDWKTIATMPEARKGQGPVLLLIDSVAIEAEWMPVLGWVEQEVEEVLPLDDPTHWAEIGDGEGAARPPPSSWPAADGQRRRLSDRGAAERVALGQRHGSP